MISNVTLQVRDCRAPTRIGDNLKDLAQAFPSEVSATELEDGELSARHQLKQCQPRDLPIR